MRAAKLAGIDYDSKIFRGGRMERMNTIEKVEDCEILTVDSPSADFLNQAINVKGFTVDELFKFFNASFLNEEVCREWILRRLYPDTVKCPACKSIIVDATTLKNFWELKRCRCKNCKKWFSAKVGTIFDNGQMIMSEIAMLAIFLYLKVPYKVIAEKLNMHPVSVSMWEKKFRMFEYRL
ncbi:MAG: hypothetical protein HY096_00420 [Nitrospinae bacterium]|nr:hypothetical protein [Nitrospinota bacterium]